MVKKFISPSLADLSQDIAGKVPVGLVQSWIEGNSSSETAEKLLGAYKVRGTLVSSDTSGLSKLSKEKDLLEVLRIVSDPKELIYGMGRHIGGQGVGRWVADNTQMFFPEEISVADVVNAVFEANRRILAECAVKVGFCIHHGQFLNFGDGFYGEEADFMEEVAENRSDGGEILITKTVAEKITDEFKFEEKKLETEIPEPVFSLKEAAGMPEIEIKERDYPIYFDQGFFDLLKNLGEEGVGDKIYAEYSKTKMIVLIQKNSSVATKGLVGLLDSLIENTVFSAILKRLDEGFGALPVKLAGSFAIYAFEIDELEKAIDFARKVRDEARREGFDTTTGIESGDVLIFPITDTERDIAGDPVNVASKQAQDFGKKGKIYITKKAAGNLKVDGAEEYSVEVSRVPLEGIYF